MPFDSLPNKDFPGWAPTAAPHSRQPGRSFQPRNSNKGPFRSWARWAQENIPCRPPGTDIFTSSEGFVNNGVQESRVQCLVTQTTVLPPIGSLIPPTGLHSSQFHAWSKPLPRSRPWTTPFNHVQPSISASRAQWPPSDAESPSFTPVPVRKVPKSSKGRSATSVWAAEELRHSFAKHHKPLKAEATSDFASAFTRPSLEAGNREGIATGPLINWDRTSGRTLHRDSYSKSCCFDQADGRAGQIVGDAEAYTEAVVDAVGTQPRIENWPERALEGPWLKIGDSWIAGTLEQKRRLLMANSNGEASRNLYGVLGQQRREDDDSMAMSPFSQATEQEQDAGECRPMSPFDLVGDHERRAIAARCAIAMGQGLQVPTPSTQSSTRRTHLESERPVWETPRARRRPPDHNIHPNPRRPWHNNAPTLGSDAWWLRGSPPPPGRRDETTPRFLRRTPYPEHTEMLDAYSLEESWRDVSELEKVSDGGRSPKNVDSLDVGGIGRSVAEAGLEMVSEDKEQPPTPRPTLHRTASNAGSESDGGSDESDEKIIAPLMSRMKAPLLRPIKAPLLSPIMAPLPSPIKVMSEYDVLKQKKEKQTLAGDAGARRKQPMSDYDLIKQKMEEEALASGAGARRKQPMSHYDLIKQKMEEEPLASGAGARRQHCAMTPVSAVHVNMSTKKEKEEEEEGDNEGQWQTVVNKKRNTYRRKKGLAT